MLHYAFALAFLIFVIHLEVPITNSVAGKLLAASNESLNRIASSGRNVAESLNLAASIPESECKA